MRRLIKANNSRKDSIEAYAYGCTCSCLTCSTSSNKVSRSASNAVTNAQK